jgi:hypothetical protein
LPVKVKSNVKIRIKISRIKGNVKGVGQECPTHMGKVKVSGGVR